MKYILLPGIDLSIIPICDEYKKWLYDWLYKLNEDIENGIISSARCVQGIICEEILGQKNFDWLSIESNLLRNEDGVPIAYSPGFGKKLYKFDSQWKQSPVYSIYNSFWINKLYKKDISVYKSFIINLIQKNGWIYNPETSNTQIRTRMKSELLMSMAMGTEILTMSRIDEDLSNCLEATLASTPLTGYISAEYFRKIALENLKKIYQFPKGIEEMLCKCEAESGYNDFCVTEKIDDYMGTRKKTQHDKPVHTPLITAMVINLCKLSNSETINYVNQRIRMYANYLRKNPMDIPAFKMRDIEYPFGSGITPLELASASIIMNLY